MITRDGFWCKVTRTEYTGRPFQFYVDLKTQPVISILCIDDQQANKLFESIENYTCDISVAD